MIKNIDIYFESFRFIVPNYISAGLLIVFCLGSIFFLAYFRKQVFRRVSELLLFEYIFYLFSMTVFFRYVYDDRNFNFTPFWSYSRPELIVENIMNCIVFIPIGFLLGLAYKKMIWWKVLLIGICISVPIEVLQYIYRRGFSEFDDVMHNTLGCILGYGLIYFIKSVYLKLAKRNIALP